MINYQVGQYKQTRLSIPKMEFEERIEKVQAEMQRKGLDLLLTHSCECESSSVRYLSNFWPIFDFAGVLIPREGKPVLLTGGPESYDYASQFSMIEDVRIHPLYVESNAPVWDKSTSNTDFTEVIKEMMQRIAVKRIGICNSNIIPSKILDDLKKGAGEAEILDTDDLFSGIKFVKSVNEIALLREAYKITEEAMKAALESVKPGVSEWEIEAAWRKKAYEMGAEGTSYPIWVTSGKSTYQSLCRSTDRKLEENDLVQLTFGAKYNGYCGNMCRSVVIGKIPDRVEKMLQVALDALNEALVDIKPGVPAAYVYEHFSDRLSSNGYQGYTLYGPAHGTGLQECEGPWIDNRSELVIQPNMVLNIDIWITDGEYGVRFEDGILVTHNGIEELTSYKREIIRI